VLLASSFAVSAAGIERRAPGETAIVVTPQAAPPVGIYDGSGDEDDGDADDIAGFRSEVIITVGADGPETARYHRLITAMWAFMLWMR
jgi:hypothetical protein